MMISSPYKLRRFPPSAASVPWTVGKSGEILTVAVDSSEPALLQGTRKSFRGLRLIDHRGHHRPDFESSLYVVAHSMQQHITIRFPTGGAGAPTASALARDCWRLPAAPSTPDPAPHRWRQSRTWRAAQNPMIASCRIRNDRFPVCRFRHQAPHPTDPSLRTRRESRLPSRSGIRIHSSFSWHDAGG